MSPIRRSKADIGKLLVQKGLINEEQLKEAVDFKLGHQKDKALGQILLELGYLKREDLHYALAIQSGYPYININSCKFRPEVRSVIPPSFVKSRKIVPIDKIEGILTVAMVDPLDKQTIFELERMTALEIKIFLTTLSEYQGIISLYYRDTEE